MKALPHEITPILQRPDLVIEIVSREDEVADMLAKIGDYLAAGIPHIWVVDPYKRTLAEADRDRIRRPAGLALQTALVGEVDFAALFQQLDEPPELTGLFPQPTPHIPQPFRNRTAQTCR